jgi:hypothetical protein
MVLVAYYYGAVHDVYSALCLPILFLDFGLSVLLHMEGLHSSVAFIEHLDRYHLLSRSIMRCMQLCPPNNCLATAFVCKVKYTNFSLMSLIAGFWMRRVSYRVTSMRSSRF